MLPGMDGIETLKRIKQFDENIPVIMLSAQGSIEVAVEALRFGAFDYFTKPIDQQKLELAIKNSIRNYDLTRELQNLKENVKKEYSFDSIISSDGKMQDVFKLVTKVLHNDCLLYTSDAADERSSVDLGGRRIIKKKNNQNRRRLRIIEDYRTKLKKGHAQGTKRRETWLNNTIKVL